MSVKDIYNFVEIDGRIATGGQPTPEQFEAAREEGFEVVINLAPVDAENNAIAKEDDLLASLGIDYFHIPMAWSEPKLEQFEDFCAAMEQVNGRKVLVHCAANFRVSAVVSSYAIKHLGWSVEQADELVNKIWSTIPDYTMDETWQAYIAETRRDEA